VTVVARSGMAQYGRMAQARTGRTGYHHGGRTGYHHGDLANALADAATDMARDGGPEAVVLRAAARRAGVSAAAAYRHFADHGDLLLAVKQRALTALSAAMQAGLETGTAGADPALEAVRKFRLLGAAYIDFALADPGLFRTAFCRPGREDADVPTRITASRPYQLLARVLDELVSCGLLAPDRRPLAEIATWSAVHGLAVLLIDGPLARLPPDERARSIQRTLDVVIDGITAGPRWR
jgi:AcrR family transcriptional regulator